LTQIFFSSPTLFFRNFSINLAVTTVLAKEPSSSAFF
jgi:hypothetical protein